MNRPNIKKFLNDNAFENGFYESGLYLILKDADNYIDHLESKESSRLSGIISESECNCILSDMAEDDDAIKCQNCKPNDKRTAVALLRRCKQAGLYVELDKDIGDFLNKLGD